MTGALRVAAGGVGRFCGLRAGGVAVRDQRIKPRLFALLVIFGVAPLHDFVVAQAHRL